MKRVLLGHVPVDSASVVIADPSALGRYEGESRDMDEVGRLCALAGATNLNDMHKHDPPELPFSGDAAWVAHCSRRHGGVLGTPHATPDGIVFGDAVVAATGMGDGLYPVYAEVLEVGDVDPEYPFMVGRVARIVIDCQLLDPDCERVEPGPPTSSDEIDPEIRRRALGES